MRVVVGILSAALIALMLAEFFVIAVNALLVVIWAATSSGFFWPIFPILGWGIGVAANAYDVYGRRPISEDEIRREADRLRQ